MKGVKFLILGLLVSIHIQVNANDYVFEPVTSNTGITFNAINSVVEDRYGFIWFGCNNGLFYYNSSEIVKFNFDNSKPDAPQSRIIRYLYKDKAGKLWLGTANGICYLDEKINSFSQLKFTNANDFGDISTTLIQQIDDDRFLAIINGNLFTYSLSELHLDRVRVASTNTGVSYFSSDNQGNFYIAANNGSIYKTDSLLADFETMYDVSPYTVRTLSYIDDQLWLGYTNNGIEIINENGEHVSFLKEELEGSQHIINNRIRRIIKRSNGEIWIGTLDGITVINSDGNTDILPNIHNGLPHKGIFDLYVDRNDGIWVATWAGGLAFHHKFNYRFTQYQTSQADNTAWNSVISSFSEDENGIIWVGCENKGLYKFNPSDGRFEKMENSIVKLVKTLKSDNQQRLWIGTFFEGLWLMENGKTKRIGDINGIFSTILPTANGVWAGKRSGGGTVFYNERRNTFDSYTADYNDSTSICSNLIWHIFEDSKGNIWFSSDNGISVKYKNDDHFTNYYENTHGLSSNINYTFIEDQKGNIWIGTAGSGIDIFDPKTDTFSKFSLNEAIKNADIYCILIDKKGDVWFSSDQGIYAFYQDSHQLKHFTEEDGLLGQQYHPNSGLVSKEGYLFFGGRDGFNFIDPEIVQPNTNEVQIFFSQLTVNNQSIATQKPEFINSEHLSAIEHIELSYKQNSIAIAFVANSFIKNAESKFRYRLLNYIDEWNFTDYNANITFTKIPPGDYILQAEYFNNDGLNVAPLKEISIKIKPPFWLAWYAFIFYSLLLLGIIFIALLNVRFREKSRAEQLLFTEKVKFFTNVSHEFRTPLTLIISPINNLLKKFASDPSTTDNLKIINRNADRLLRLTNQILDFRLIETDNVKISRENVDLIALSKNVYDCFEFQMSEKEINCIFNSSFTSFKLDVDAEKIEKVVYNILSNALKYSKEKGQIILSIEKRVLTPDSYSKVFTTGTEFIGDAFEIKIRDSGKGIKQSILNNIFDRFFVDSENTETGTGIGLHICQEYMRMHNGNIMVESEPGKESTFTINIPIESQTNFEKEPLILQSFFDSTSEKNIDDEDESVSKTKPIILFAEDNNELRGYYKNLLSSKYKVISAKNGSQALEIASELIPNLIISDILMPGIDGIMLTEKIRSSPELKHIPIILLTALSEKDVKIESIKKGANEFLTKPVDEELLFAKIDSVLRNYEVMMNKYKGEVDTSSESHGSQTFIEKVEQIVENNLQNQSFEITELASQIGISRSSLQRKIKRAVNMSPSEFIREVRLKKAVVLLKSNEYNIDEIAIIVGFNSTSYFIRSFKKKYEMTPTDYKQRIEK